MRLRLTYLISSVLLLSLVGQVQAQFPNHDSTWTDATGDHLWTTPENWSEFPTPGAWAKIRNGLPGPTIPSGVDAVARRVHVGYSEGGALTVDGGTLVLHADDLLLGKNGGEGILNMISGTIDVARDFEVGGGDPGVVNMSGGTITVADDFMIPELVASSAEVNLDGGTIIINGDLTMRADGETMNGKLNITAGTLRLAGNVVSTAQGYIDNGWITAYGGNGSVQLDYDVTNQGQTTLKGVHKLTPNPIDGGLAAPGTLELSWALPDPCVPGEPVLVDVYFTDSWEALYSFTDPASIQVVSKSNVTSVTVQTLPKTQYYWAVDIYIGDPNDPIFGPLFGFLADNQGPQVNAGQDLLTWLGDDGARVKDLDATVTDDDAYTVQWAVVSEPDDPNSPDAVIADPSAEDTSITLSAVGEYVLQLEASDGEYTGSDTVTINVYNDGCEAARSLPDYVPLAGDLNGDCKVDDLDFAILQEDWLTDNSLTEP
ncbi:MAG: hypothetical protein ACYTBS_06295 [Planctomycetota bacterium]|jgi:hypothetical protein